MFPVPMSNRASKMEDDEEEEGMKFDFDNSDEECSTIPDNSVSAMAKGFEATVMVGLASKRNTMGPSSAQDPTVKPRLNGWPSAGKEDQSMHSLPHSNSSGESVSAWSWSHWLSFIIAWVSSAILS